MINAAENPEGVKFPDSSPSPTTSPADIMSSTGWKPSTAQDPTPKITAELQDTDGAARVKTVSVDVENVTSIEAILKNDNGDVVMTATVSWLIT